MPISLLNKRNASTDREVFGARRTIAILLVVAPLEQVVFDIYTPSLPKIAADAEA